MQTYCIAAPEVPATEVETPTIVAPAKKISAYDVALSAIQQLSHGDDWRIDAYRAALIEALILTHVRAETGRNDPAGELAMRLRREAAAA